ncbi:MAG: hypothetical protein H6696_08280 [Deferribacteres bacterium]|nr:hypothetical protein [candidate division KSB1 bacterium]MCB9501919.1 hypothetical protein [Deferribacteres bacterium]
MKIAPKIDAISTHLQRPAPVKRTPQQDEINKIPQDTNKSGIQGVVRNRQEEPTAKFKTIISDTALASTLSADEKSFIHRIFRDEETQADPGYARNLKTASQVRLGQNIDVKA